MALPTSGSFPGPKMISARTKMTISSIAPIPNMPSLPLLTAIRPAADRPRSEPPAAFYRKYTVPHMSGKAGPPTGNGLRQPHRRLGTGLWTRVDPATGRAAWPRAVQPGRGPYSLATSRTAWPWTVQPSHGPYSLAMDRTAWPSRTLRPRAVRSGRGPSSRRAALGTLFRRRTAPAAKPSRCIGGERHTAPKSLRRR